MSGANRSLITLVEELQNQGQTYVFALDDSELAAEARKVGAEVVTAFGKEGLPASRTKRWVGIVSALGRAVGELGTEVIHAHSPAGNRYAWPVAKRSGVPLVTHERETYARNYSNAGLGLADHIVAVSFWVNASLPASIRKKSTVVYNAVKLPEMPDIRESGGKTFRVGMAGRCTSDKGQDLLIRAGIHLMKKYDLEVCFKGVDRANRSDRYTDGILRKIEDAGGEVVKRMHLEPFSSDMESFFRSLDIVVVPSRWNEGFGRMAIESMAWQKPVVVSNRGGLIEIVDDGRTGLVAAADDWEDLARCIESLIVDEDLRRRLAADGRREAEARFCPEVHAEKMLRVYRRALRKGMTG